VGSVNRLKSLMDLQQCLCFVTDWSELGPLNLQDHKSWFWSGFLEVLFQKHRQLLSLCDVGDRQIGVGLCRKTLKRKKLFHSFKKKLSICRLKHDSCLSLQPWQFSSLTAPNLQHTANQERNDQCGNQHYSRELLMMGILVPETCWTYKKYNKITSGI